MDQTTRLLILVVAIVVTLVAALIIVRRQRRERESASRESPFATSSEGQKRCPNCGSYNACTDRNCVSCGRRLPG
jgi:conjugative transfer region protein TrbK